MANKGSFQTLIDRKIKHVVFRETLKKPSLANHRFWNNLKAGEPQQSVLVVSRQMEGDLSGMLRTILPNTLLLGSSSSIQEVTGNGHKEWGNVYQLGKFRVGIALQRWYFGMLFIYKL